LRRMNTAFEQGVAEIWLTSEDTGAYGRDINTSIVDLMVLLIKAMPAGKMIRVGMTNPPYILEHLEGIAHIMNHPQVYKFLHIPVQAGNNNTLERMNREYTVEDFEKVSDYLLANVPDMTISTDIICGFPGETEEEFLGTYNLVKKYKFPVLNISQFYPRPGTVAERMKPCNSIDKKDRSRRVTEALTSYKNMDHMMDRTERVWVSEWENHSKSGKICIGHTYNYSKVVIPYEENLLGKMIIMKINKCSVWHIEGEIIDRNPEPVKAADDVFAGIEKMYARIKQEKEAILQKRNAERRERLKAMRLKA
jgi:threonylcarbamoyladenosine tRNA methylthiotransferase CDKAL1